MIEINKEAPSDETARKVLAVWFNILLPKWAKPAIIGAFAFFLVCTVGLMSREPILPIAWISLLGVVVSLAVMFAYMPLMIASTLKRQKAVPSYYQEKQYRFYDDRMSFSSGGGEPIDIPLDKFSTLYATKTAVLFLIGDKLAFWLSTADIPVDQLDTIIASFEKNGVPVRFR